MSVVGLPYHELVHEWTSASWELAWGIVKRFYLWILPLVFLQPLDLLDKLGIEIVIPDTGVYVLVAVGLLVSAVDIVRISRSEGARLSAQSHAREVAGSLFTEPGLTASVDADAPRNAAVQPFVRVHNRGNRPVQYSVVEVSATIDGRALPSVGPTTIVTLSPGDHMDYRIPVTGPYAIDADLRLTLTIRYVFGLLFSSSVAEEEKTYTFSAHVERDGEVSPILWSVEEAPRAFGIILFKPGSKSVEKASR